MYKNNKDEASKMLAILRAKFRTEKRAHVRAAIRQQADKILEIFPDLDVIAVVAHKTGDGIAIAWSHANSGVIARDVIKSEIVDSPHKAVVIFAKSLLRENRAFEVVCDLDSFVKVCNSTTKTKTLPQDIDLLRYAISTGKLIVRRPVAGKGEEFFAKLHKECKRMS